MQVERFHDAKVVHALVGSIQDEFELIGRPLRFMEVCGTHTHSIARAGIRHLIPKGLRLISGPGCSVCVTPISYMDQAVALARRPDVIVASFGDLLRVPSSSSSLEIESAKGARVEVVYSSRDALELARNHPTMTVVFLGVGFETTIPTVAASLAEAESLGLSNYRVLVGAKLIEPPLRVLAHDPKLQIDGFLLPGHVSVIVGSDFYSFLQGELGLPSAIVGFDPVDILLGIRELVRQAAEGIPRVTNLYGRAVSAEGNPQARELVSRFFEVVDAPWRGLGEIPASGLAFRPAFSQWDASLLEVQLDPPVEPHGCRCGEILRGSIEPPECPLFDHGCTPLHAIGACMVSSEGTCAAWYRHERHNLAGANG